MNTSGLKTFAPAVRRQLIEAVTRKLDFALSAQTPDYLTTFAPQVAALRKHAQADRTGLIERVAYTWFNRLAALRFMDARGWHPFRARVLTPASAVETQPELLKLTRTGALPEELKAHTDPARLNELLDGRIPSPDAQGEVYRHLVLAACRFYHALLPNLFERLDDETELLLPDDLLTEHSVVRGFRTEISDEDCGDGQRANVEILGWLYQFYISERKDQVMARKSAVPTEDIPAVTQLFTPHWIVRYLVENSLGRLWLLNRPGSRLREHMPYYIEGESSATSGSPAETDFLKVTKPEEIRMCDPAVGSGHMLTYAFDLLTLIYEEEGYAPTEIPALILRHNLHGLEICPRATQLAELALVFKAREKSRRFFQPEHLVRPRIIELRDVRFAENELRDYIHALGLGDLFNQPMLKLLHQFEEAKNFGSLIQPCLDEPAIALARRAIEAKDLGGQLFLRETHLKVQRVLEQAEALTQRYHVVVANPPYMGSKGQNGRVRTFLQDRFEDYKADLFSAFIARSRTLALDRGFLGFMCPFVWMFISSYESLRRNIILSATLTSLIQLEYSGFDGATVPICTFCFRNSLNSGYKGTFIRLSKFRGPENQSPRTLEAIANPHCGWMYSLAATEFIKIPGVPIAYWIKKSELELFESCNLLEDICELKKGLDTGKNALFLRYWHEIPLSKSSWKGGLKWFPYNKGGNFRRWYGNREYVVNWENSGEAIHTFNDVPMTSNGAPVRAKRFYFKEGYTWTTISSGGFSARFTPQGAIFDNGGCSMFTDGDLHFVGALVNSALANRYLEFISPTLNFQPGDIGKIPVAETKDNSVVSANAQALVQLSEIDWNSLEQSWDFHASPFLNSDCRQPLMATTYRSLRLRWQNATMEMKRLEEENNLLLLQAVGLHDEMSPEVSLRRITLNCNPYHRYDSGKSGSELEALLVADTVREFLSYAVGCMMGRYSPDQPGLILANPGDTLREFLAKVGRPHEELTFAPDEDGIIPVVDGEWFEDDIVARTRDFLRATFGEATLRENLRFIEDSLGKDLRKYFLNDFYKDHLQTYKKRPIYWLVQSPRKGFSVLLYLHRYTRDTMNLVLNRYLRDYQVKLRNRLAHLTQVQATAPTAREKTEARKEADKLTKTLHECDEWERQIVLPLAQARIELDLDDGVKTNYLKLGEALAPMGGLTAKEEE